MPNIFKQLNQELPGHKWYRGTTDVILEWREPAVIRQRLARMQLKKLTWRLPILFPVSALFGLLLFAGKVNSKGHSLSEIPWTGLIMVSCILGSLLCLQAFSYVAILRWHPTVVRLASRGVGKWANKPDTRLHVDYTQIRSAFVDIHPVVPEIKAITLALEDGRQVSLALPDSMEPGTILEILSEHGVPIVPGEGKGTNSSPPSL